MNSYFINKKNIFNNEKSFYNYKCRIKLKNKIINDKIITNKLVVYAKHHSNLEGMNFILKNDKSMIYYCVLCLYFILSTYNCKDMNILNINVYDMDDKMVLDILHYAENIVNLLLKQRKYYYSDNKLKKKYELIKCVVDKEILTEKLMIQMKIQKEIENAKKEKLKVKINKKYFKPKRRIDFDYYRKETHKKKQIFINSGVKNGTKFEDFLYDIYA